jgi:hypothetical protein
VIQPQPFFMLHRVDGERRFKMRSFFKVTGLLLLAIMLIYCGLNLVEQGMNELLSHERSPAAFTLHQSPDKELVITFAGDTVVLNYRQLLLRFAGWLERMANLVRR